MSALKRRCRFNTASALETLLLADGIAVIYCPLLNFCLGDWFDFAAEAR